MLKMPSLTPPTHKHIENESQRVTQNTVRYRGTYTDKKAMKTETEMHKKSNNMCTFNQRQQAK